MQAPHALLKMTRQELGLTKAQAAVRCGVSLSAWEKWEAGRSDMKPPVLAGVLLMLDVDADTARQAARSLL